MVPTAAHPIRAIVVISFSFHQCRHLLASLHRDTLETVKRLKPLRFPFIPLVIAATLTPTFKPPLMASSFLFLRCGLHSFSWPIKG
jgi:hypothetical protein